jgi:hypothetical protein
MTTTTDWACRCCGGSQWEWVEQWSHDGRESWLVKACVKHGVPVKYSANAGRAGPLIEVGLFAPFSDPADQVVCLRFQFNQRLTDGLKETLRRARLQADPSGTAKAQGGWLPQYRVWFVKPAAWPLVRTYLLAQGCRLSDDPLPAPPPPPPSPPPPSPPSPPRVDPKIDDFWARKS